MTLFFSFLCFSQNGLVRIVIVALFSKYCMKVGLFSHDQLLSSNAKLQGIFIIIIIIIIIDLFEVGIHIQTAINVICQFKIAINSIYHY